MVNIQIFNIVGLTCLNLSCRVKLIFSMALHAGIFVELWHSPQLIRNINNISKPIQKNKKINIQYKFFSIWVNLYIGLTERFCDELFGQLTFLTLKYIFEQWLTLKSSI